MLFWKQAQIPISMLSLTSVNTEAEICACAAGANSWENRRNPQSIISGRTGAISLNVP